MLANFEEQCELVLLFVILNLKEQSPQKRTQIVAFAWFRKTDGFVPAEGLFQPRAAGVQTPAQTGP